ncbi:MAG: hypothetical protein DWP95_11805 [Proteobacteria bacterium]|nr:MAG: hypothetical protein DWP95_11805 [Pseudomonadota bacterium]
MMWFNDYWPLLLIWAVLLFLLLQFYVKGVAVRFLDSANHRSLHHGEVLTGGGFFIFVPLVAIMLWQQLYLPATMVLCLTLVGIIDDVKTLTAGLRFFVQLVVVVVTLWFLDFGLSWWGLFLCLAFLWWLNLFNFMDGANGLVAMHAIVTLTVMTWLLVLPSNIMLLLVLVIVALLVYLYFNVVLKQLFMGDSGSLPLAFIVALTTLMALQMNALSAMQIAVMHAVLITDSSLTLIIRAMRGERLTQAHRSHLYQRLIAQNRPHWQISLAYAGVTMGCCLVALVMTKQAVLHQVVWFLSVYAVLVIVFFHSRDLGR